MTPEHLIATAQLSQWYKFGLTEGNYTHSATANVKISTVGSSSTVLSTPSLLDLLNDDDVAPQDVDREALEQALFNHPDPYDLAETDRVDNAISSSLETVPRVIRSSTHWVCSSRKSHLGREEKGPAEGVVQSQAAEATVEPENQDWDVED
ncbi:hypothetical protein B0H10DRAFT_1962298 [Mycena sp. CBHHK59/15]|nr:hypothetical protein B0H10DRAFT_1962298 [Mycena sp. CBHHK59/15]